MTKGAVVMDASALAACEAELDAAGCETDASWTFDPHGACAGIFHPTNATAATGACRVDEECGAGRYCEVKSPFCVGTCLPLPSAGERCGKGFECGYALGCNYDVTAGEPRCGAPVIRPLIPVALVGEPCDDDSPRAAMCELNATCQAGRCVAGRDLGERCRIDMTGHVTSDDCAVGVCTFGVCAPHGSPASACGSAADCAEGLACLDGACAATCE